MNWYESLEQRKGAVIFSLLLLCTAMLALSSLRDPLSYDSFWHLKTGQDWIESDLSPWIDHYSFTYNGSKIESQPIWFQAALYRLVKSFGLDTGYKLFKFVCTMLVLLLTLAWLKMIKASTVVYCVILPLMVTVLQMRSLVRPELLSFSFFVLALMLYERARTGIATRTMLPIALLMLVWTNYHNSLIGYVIFFGLFVDLGILQLNDGKSLKTWVSWAAWGAVIVFVGFLNPGFSHPVVALVSFSSEWKDLIQEYQLPLEYIHVPAIYPLVLMAIALPVLLIRQRHFGYLMIFVILLSQAATTARMVGPTGIVLLCIFARVLGGEEFRNLVFGGSRGRKLTVTAAALVVFLVTMSNGVLASRALVFENPGMLGHFPRAMVKYMKDTERDGRILNEYELGGFLIYSLAPDSQVYIDGRTNILYPVEHFLRLREAKESAAVMRSELEKYQIDYAVLGNSAENAELMAATGLMSLDFADLRYFLYSRKDASFPVSGRLWGKPYCWTEELGEALVQEQIKAIMELPSYSPLVPFLSIAAGYVTAEDKNLFVSELYEVVGWKDPSQRLAGYLAIRHHQYALAIRVFTAIRKKEPKDFLAAALANLRLKKIDEAERVLDQATKIKWNVLEYEDLVTFHGLLREIQAQRPLKFIEQEYFDGLNDRVDNSETASYGERISTEKFCTDDPGNHVNSKI